MYGLTDIVANKRYYYYYNNTVTSEQIQWYIVMAYGSWVKLGANAYKQGRSQEGKIGLRSQPKNYT